MKNKITFKICIAILLVLMSCAITGSRPQDTFDTKSSFSENYYSDNRFDATFAYCNWHPIRKMEVAIVRISDYTH